MSNLTVTGLSVSLSVAGTSTTYAVPPNVGTFTFTTTLPTSTTYSAVIAQQPLGFTQVCALANGSGTIAQANVNNVAITCNTATAVVTTVAGSTTSGYVDGSPTVARFNNQHGIALDGAGNLYVTDQGNSAARKIVLASGVVSTLGPVPVSGSTNTDDAAADAAGNMYIADSNYNVIRKITAGGVASVFAGSSTLAGSADGTTTATFNSPHGLAIDSAGNVYVAERSANTIAKISATGTVSVVAGTTTNGYVDGPAASARFRGPIKVAVDAPGNLYVSDADNNSIRMITTAGVVSTLAGSTSGTIGSANGVGTAATFQHPWGLAVSAAGVVYVSNQYNNLIRKITPQ